tara:strand:+ start:116 stop:430 length:315 start_codon:yes stop_codon:yes gene_type:complete
MGKISQFTTVLTCKCVGRPSMGTGGVEGTVDVSGRIQCDREISMAIDSAGPVALTTGLIKKQTKPFLESAGWKSLKTLGYFQRLCPKCSEYVLQMRARDKSRWG